MDVTGGYQPIENYGVIGNLHTVALVGMNGSIDSLCLPRFDSPSVFAALLDTQKGGRFKLAPAGDDFRVKQTYLAGTNVLVTRFLSDSGIAEVTDFMPICRLGHGLEVARLVKAPRGHVRLRLLCQPRFDYARAAHKIQRRGNDVLFLPENPGQPALRLRSDVPLRVDNGAATADFKLRAGQARFFLLEELAGADSPSASPDYVFDALNETIDFWIAWTQRSEYRGRWREMVSRSALTLKLLISQPDGAIVAAPTFSLPAQFGGSRNWDYRYTWIRDSCFTIDALMRLGYFEEAGAFGRWIEKRAEDWNEREPLQPLYRIDGGRELREQCLTHFEGYLKSQPVRIGNEACRQFQLDVCGELLDAVHVFHRHAKAMSREFWIMVSRLVDWVGRHWRQPDKSIWEFRTQSRQFLFSRLMSWVALDRGIRLAIEQSLPAPLMRWHDTRDRIYRDIHRHFWDAGLGAFTQFRGGKSLDASALLMPRMRFISATDPRWLQTMRAIENELSEDFLLYRYNGPHASHGIGGPRGAFCMCTFWWTECLASAGDLKKAQRVFERILGYANHLGLYAEQIGPSGHHQGNFPQGLSHCSLIRAAVGLNAVLGD